MGLRRLAKIGDVLDNLAKGISFFCLCMMIVIMVTEVIARNVYMSLIWSEELAATFFGTWFVFVGACVPLKAGQLICVQFITSILPGKIGTVVTVVGELMTLIFLAVVVIYGFDLVKLAIRQPSPALMFPMAIAYLAIPVGSIIMFYQTSVLMLQGKPIGGGASIT